MLGEETAAISVKQFLESFNLKSQLFPLVGIFDPEPMLIHLDNLGRRNDVRTPFDGIFSGCERLVLDKLETAGMVDEGIAGDARLLVIGL